jgi:hypothetical protein
MDKSIRQTILEAMQDAFEAVTPGTDPGDFDFAFSEVNIGPLGDPDVRKLNAIGLVVGRERKEHQYPFEMCFLPVDIEFRVTVNRGDDPPAVMAETVLTPIQMVLYNNKTLGGIAIDGYELGNEIDLTSYADKSVQGVVNWEVQYRHRHLDVTDPNPSI